MAGKLSFSIAINLLTENFKRGADQVKGAFRAMQMQVLTFAAALGAGGLGLSSLVTNFINVARETSRAVTALKNVSGSLSAYANNQKFVNDQAAKYGLEINALTSNFAKFTASANISGMSLANQRKIFESVSRATVAFGMSAEDSNGTFLALSQMMSKGKISSEELRLQMGERLPIALQAMAKAAGVSVAGLDKLLKQGKLMSADILPKFADALNEMIPNINTDNLETSVNRLKNIFQELTASLGVGDKYKKLVDLAGRELERLKNGVSGVVNFIIAIIAGKLGTALAAWYLKQAAMVGGMVKQVEIAETQKLLAVQKRIAAEKTLEATLTDYNTIQNGQRLAGKVKVNNAEMALERAKTAEKRALLAATTAAEKAAAVSSATGFGKVFAAMRVGIIGVISSLKAMAISFAPMAIIAGVTWIITSLISAQKEAKRVRNIFSDYKKESANLPVSDEIVKLRAIQSLYNKSNDLLGDKQKYLNQINGILGTELKANQDINGVIEDRIKLLEAQAKIDFYTRKKIESDDRLRSISQKTGIPTKALNSYAKDYNSAKDYNAKDDVGWEFQREIQERGVSRWGSQDILKEASDQFSVSNDAENQMRSALEYVAKNEKKVSIATGTPDAESKKKSELQKSEEKYNDSLRELQAQLDLNKISGGKIGITQAEYEKALYELQVKTLVDAKGTGDKALLNSKYLSKLEDSVKNPAVNFDELKTNVELEAAKKKYADSFKDLVNLRDSGAITEEEYQSKLQDLISSTVDLTGSLLGARAKNDKFYTDLVSKKNSKVDNIAIDYNKELKELNNLRAAGQISEEEYNNSLRELIDKTKGLAASLLGASAKTNTFYKGLDTARPAQKYDYKAEASDIMSNSKYTDTEKLAALKESARKSAADLLDEVNKELSKTTSLPDALKLAQARIEIKELTKELNRGRYEGVKDMVSDADRVVSAWSNLSDVFSDVDASGWERIMAVWEALTSTIDAFLGIIDMIERMTALTKQLAGAKQDEAKIDKTVTGQKIANAVTGAAADNSITGIQLANSKKKVAANTSEAGSAAAKSVAGIPFVGIGLAAAAIGAILMLMNSLPKFESGGIVGGTSTTGDKILARVNSGELILNRVQQASLLNQLDGNSQIVVSGELRAKGTDLIAVITASQKKINRGR